MENKKRIGFAMCGSYCTYSRAFEEAERLTEKYELIPIMSENAAETDSRFGAASENIGRLLNRKNVYFVPFRQDDAAKKPRSLQSDFSLIDQTVEAALRGWQIQPIIKN